MLTNKKGFTLIELLVVIFIIGILAAVIMPNLIGARQRGRDSKRKSDLESVKNSLRMYYNDNQEYPADGWASLNDLVDDYITALPIDPVDDDGYVYDYVQIDDDSFYMTAVLEVGSGVESQTACNQPSLADNIFVVCAN